MLPDDSHVTVWDLVNFTLFDRNIAVFDILTIIIAFVDGISLARPVALCFFLHWLLRSIGGIIGAFITFALQGLAESWRHEQSWPTIFWYTGELFADLYPFQKALAVAAGKPKLKALAYLGFVPLLLYKFALMGLRYAGPLVIDRDDKVGYFDRFHYWDAVSFLVSAWCDICCCIVILAASRRPFGRWLPFTKKVQMGSNVGDQFMDSLVLTTEVRMIICTMLAVVSAALVMSSTSCRVCGFETSARDIATKYVYCLYYLDYLIIKYRKTTLLNSLAGAPATRVPLSPLNPKYVTTTDTSLEPRFYSMNVEDSILFRSTHYSSQFALEEIDAVRL